MSRAKIIDHYLHQSQQPGFQIDQVRKELEANNVPEEEIRIIIRLVDNDLQKRLHLQENNNKGKQLIYIGITLIAIGAILTIGTYTGIMNSGRVYVIMYGPFLTGMGLLFSGLAMNRKS